MCANEKEHPLGCSLILLWVKIFKMYSFAGQLKIVCKDIFLFTDRAVNLSKQANKVKLSTQIKALRVLCPANIKQTTSKRSKHQQTKIPLQIRVLHAPVCSFGGFGIKGYNSQRL